MRLGPARPREEASVLSSSICIAIPKSTAANPPAVTNANTRAFFILAIGTTFVFWPFFTQKNRR
jgi:hypothetical protein